MIIRSNMSLATSSPEQFISRHLYVCSFTEATQGNVRIQFCLTIISECFCVCGKGQDFDNKTPVESAKHIKKTCLNIHLYFIQLHQTHLVLSISFKFMLSKINLNVSSFPALSQAPLFI